MVGEEGRDEKRSGKERERERGRERGRRVCGSDTQTDLCEEADTEACRTNERAKSGRSRLVH